VFKDKGLRIELEKLGIKFKNIGNTPVLRIGNIELKITLDHTARKVEFPMEAFSAKNLTAATFLDNTKLKEAVVVNLEELGAEISKTQPQDNEIIAYFTELARRAKRIDDIFAATFDLPPTPQQ
jgi:hypothetical protein